MKIKLNKDAFMPERAHATDAGLDLRSRDSVWIFPDEHHMFDTGVHVQIPDGYFGLVASKSGLMGKGLTSRGIIDNSYTGSIKVVLFNHGNAAYEVRKGDKISQLIIVPCAFPELELVDELEETERGDGGFGSSGR